MSAVLVNFQDHMGSKGIMENVIASKEVQVERKHLSIEFRENERGRSCASPKLLTVIAMR
jgi:hypothetical protein